jgi:Rieske Fe-S protein
VTQNYLPVPAFVASVNLGATANAALRTVGGQRIIAIGAKRYLVIRTADDAFVALSAVCPHARCIVTYPGDVVCSCPLASYDTSFDETSEILTVVLA